MRGRKPTPTALKIVRNNPGKRTINKNEPQHDRLDAECPSELTGGAKDEWTRVIGKLTATGQVTMMDRATLLGYCLKYGQWKTLEAEAAKHPAIVRSPSGYSIPNPAIGMANKAFALMLKAATELGMTPSARSRVSAVPPAASSNPLNRFTQRVRT